MSILDESTLNQMKRVRASKEAGTAALLSNLSAGFPPEFGELLDCSRRLYFNQYVDCDLIIERFRSLAARIGCASRTPQTPLDWTLCPRGCLLDVKVVPGLYSSSIISHNDKEDDITNEYYSEEEIHIPVHGLNGPGSTAEIRNSRCQLSKFSYWIAFFR